MSGGIYIKTVGVVAEYNPFHNGHEYHLSEAKRITGSKYCVVVMSGNFVQRGEPAIYDKFLRTHCALLNGADLVIELPVFSATASAQFFARGAVNILNGSHIVDFICFGAEDANIDKLKCYADFLSANDSAFIEKIKEYLSYGLSYPAARDKAFKSFGFNTDEAEKPNNILGIEYLRALNQNSSKIIPVCCERILANYHDNEIHSHIASATAIRKQILKSGLNSVKNTIPENAYRLYLEKPNTHNYNKMSQILQYIIKNSNSEELKNILNVVEGIENRIINSSSRYYNIEDIISDIKTKRYTFTKIQRTILHIILQITKNDFEQYQKKSCSYIRVLGFKKESGELLSRLESESEFPVITNLKNAEHKLDSAAMKFLEKEVEVSDLYYLTNGIACKKKYDYHVPMVII